MTTRSLSLRMPGIVVGRLNRSLLRRWPKAALISAIILIVLAFAALTADVIRPLDTRSVDLSASLESPSVAHPMGTDQVGRDLMAHALHGLRLSFSVSLIAAVFAAIIGGGLGLIAGTFGGKVDGVLMRFIDIFHSQNHFLFGILVVVLFRPTLGAAGAIMMSVALTHWVPIARIVRGELLSLRERPFVHAAINGGSSRTRIALRHHLPHLAPAIGLGFVLLIPHAIFHESGMSFLGLGMPPHQASLGNVLADSRESLLLGGWWASFFPGALIFLAAASIGTLGEYFRDRHNPRWRSELEL